MKGLGIALIVIGLVLTLVTGFKFFTKEKVVDIGKVEISADKPHSVNWSPIIGIGTMIVGGIILLADRKKAL